MQQIGHLFSRSRGAVPQEDQQPGGSGSWRQAQRLPSPSGWGRGALPARLQSLESLRHRTAAFKKNRKKTPFYEAQKTKRMVEVTVIEAPVPALGAAVGGIADPRQFSPRTAGALLTVQPGASSVRFHFSLVLLQLVCMSLAFLGLPRVLLD